MSNWDSRNLKSGEIKKRFEHFSTITYSELYEFYLEQEPNLKLGTFKWRIYHLKELGVIRSLKKGVYLFESRKPFTPPDVLKLREIYKLLIEHFPYMDVVLWDTSWFHEFMVHQPIKSNLIVEVNRESTGSVFTMLKERHNDVYVRPSKDEIQKYVQTSERSIIINPLIVDAPIFKFEHITIPKIEKILVDLFVEENLFITYQGHERKNIFEKIFENYSINVTTLYRYALKRNAKERLIRFMKNQTSIHEKYLGGVK